MYAEICGSRIQTRSPGPVPGSIRAMADRAVLLIDPGSDLKRLGGGRDWIVLHPHISTA